jgi:ArsR family metal-binding transcriptional regulator
MSEFARMPEFDEEWGRAFTAAMRAHMEQLHESVYGFDDDAEPTAEPMQVYPEYPFCGCEDCDERERYGLAMILIIEGYENGEVKLS